MNIQGIFDTINNDYSDLVFITDTNVYDLYKSYFQNSRVIVFHSSEEEKNLDTVNFIYNELLNYQVSRNTVLVGVGGGIVTDIVGFVASTYLRGVKFGFVPTTLLCMVDASIGGKNGVNYNNYKNIIGTINEPEFIYYSVDFLDTLPERELHSAFGEILKYAIGFDKKLFEVLNKYTYQELIQNDKVLDEVIDNCIKIKKEIVSKDLKESGERKKLNLGHTIGHAIEKYTHDIVHGEAVGIGLYAMTFYSGAENHIELPEVSDILKLLEKYDLAYFKKYDYNTLLKNSIDNIIVDKKRSNSNTIDIVIISKIGKCEIERVEINKYKKLIQSIFLY